MKLNALKKILQIIFVLSFIPVIYFDEIGTWMWFLRVFFSILGIISIFKIDKKYYKLILLLFLFHLFYVLPMFIQDEFTIRNLAVEFYPFGIYCLFIYFLSKDPQNFIKKNYQASFIILILCLFQLFFRLINNEAIIPLLQNNQNGMQIYLTYIIGIVILYKEYGRESKKFNLIDIFMLGFSFLFIFLSGSATGSICAIIGILLILIKKKIPLSMISMVYLIIFFLIIIFQNTDNFFLSRIFELFEKSTTFSNRIWRWDYSIELFKQNPFLGNYNILDSVNIAAGASLTMFNPHNGILSITTYGGGLALFTTFLLFIKTCKSSKIINLKSVNIVITMTLITSLMESCLSPESFVFYIFIIIAIVFKEGAFYEKLN